jgi:tetratricopeptide (TPR) repeat protein
MRMISSGLALVLALSATTTWAQGDGDLTDATSLSRYAVIDEDEGLKTVQELMEMEASWRQMLADGNCEAALPLLVEFADSANVTSNIIRQGLEPFYDADRDVREEIAQYRRVLVDELVAAERSFNQFLRMRNAAWVEEAKCLLEEGRNSEAVTRLYRALDSISADMERVLWEEARNLIWEQVGYISE